MALHFKQALTDSVTRDSTFEDGVSDDMNVAESVFQIVTLTSAKSLSRFEGEISIQNRWSQI